MYITLTITILTIIIYLVSFKTGNLINKLTNLNIKKSKALLGFLTWLASLFITSQFLDLNYISSGQLFSNFLMITVILLIVSITTLSFDLNIKDTVIIFGFVSVFIYLSTLIRLGEQMGDNIFLFNLVTKNINADILNNFNYANGFIGLDNLISTQKESLTFYHFFSFILHYYYELASVFKYQHIPAYVLTMWISNILFYTFSIMIILEILRIFKIKSIVSTLIVILFSGFYIGTYYFNLTLPHFGVTFLGLAISMTLLIIHQYFSSNNERLVWLILLMFYAMFSMGSTGLIVSFYLWFGFVIVSFYKKKDNVFLAGSLLLLPIIHYAYILRDILKMDYALETLSIAMILFFVVNYIKQLKNHLMRFYWVYLIALFFLIVYLNVRLFDNYTEVFLEFFNRKENFDRVRDYFSMETPLLVLRNSFHYVLIISLLVYDKTRVIGIILFSILFFFVNPFVYPLMYKYISFLYHRSYFTIFNITTLSMGLIALFKILDPYHNFLKISVRLIVLGIVSILLYTNLSTYEHWIYEPGPDFNPLYKMDNTQIEVLEELRIKIDEENRINIKVASQIYGTMMYVPDIVHATFTVSDRRSWDVLKDKNMNDLYRIFFTPVFDGDDGPRLDAPVHLTCKVLDANEIEYAIYDKNLSIYNTYYEMWLPTHWFAGECGEVIFENEAYILYGFNFEQNP